MSEVKIGWIGKGLLAAILLFGIGMLFLNEKKPPTPPSSPQTMAPSPAPASAEKAPTPETPPPKSSADLLKEAKDLLAQKSSADPYGKLWDAAILLYKIQPKEKEYTEAQRLIKKTNGYKAQLWAASKQEEEKKKKVLRQIYAPTLEAQFLDKGYDVSVKVAGKDATTLRLSCIIFSRPFMHNLTKDGVLVRAWQDMGFKKVVVSNGYRVTCFMDL